MRVLSSVTAALVLAILTAQAEAQSTSSGMFGQRTTGSSLGPGNRTFSAGATTGSNAASAGQISGNERFLRANHQAGQFVGADSTDAAYALRNFSIYGANAANRLQQLGGTLRSAARAAAQQQASQSAVVPPFQTAIEASFARPEISTQRVSESLARHVAGNRGIQASRPIQVAVEGDTAILRGEVASQRDRTLLEHLARFEPGIRNVRNELTVPAVKAAPPPAGQR